jgi:hypothetical protein
MARFNRVYRLLVGKGGTKGFEIVPPIRLVFEVTKDVNEEPNDHKIRLYNLAPATRKSLEEPGLRCVLYAGYAEEGGPILMASGSIVFAYTKFDQPDVVTELGQGALASSIIRDIARQMGLSLMMADDVPDRTWVNGFSFYGAARTALHKVTQGAGLEWSIQNQQLQVLQRGGTTRRRAVVLAVDTGLLGHPERVREAAQEKAKPKGKPANDAANPVSAHQERDGWSVKSLLLPMINPGDLVKLESHTVEAFQRVEKVQHKGDSETGDWLTELNLVDRYAPAKKKDKK